MPVSELLILLLKQYNPDQAASALRTHLHYVTTHTLSPGSAEQQESTL
jgi:DTW domain-containing protein YfiP